MIRIHLNIDWFKKALFRTHKRVILLRHTKAWSLLFVSARRRIGTVSIVAVSVIVSLVVVFHSSGAVKAQSISLGSSDLLAGNASFNEINIAGGSSIQLQRGDIGSWANDDGTEVPPLRIGDTSITTGPNGAQYLMVPMSGQCHFMRYDIDVRQYITLTRPPVGCGSGLQIVFDQQKTIYYLPGNTSERLFAYDTETDTWGERASVPAQVGSGASAVYATQGAGRYLYAFRGFGSTSFWRYDIAQNSWSSLMAFPTVSNVTYGYSMAWNGANEIYVYTNWEGEFKRYSISSNAWTAISKTTQSYYKSALSYYSGQVIQMQLDWSGERTYLRSYNTANNTWSSLPRPPIGGNYYDGVVPLSYDGSRYLYTYAGTDYNANLYRFDLQTSTWTAKTMLDQAQDDAASMLGLVYDGAQSVYFVGGKYLYSTDRVYKYDLVTGVTTRIGAQFGTSTGWAGAYYNNGLYYMDVQNNTGFQRYDLSTNAWTPLATLPAASGYGAGIIDGGDGYLYATFQSTNRFYRYNIAGNTWNALANMPDSTGAGSGITRIGRTIYVQVGAASGRLLKYNMDTNSWSASITMPNGKLDHGAFLVGDGTRYLYSGLATRSEALNKRYFRYDTQNDSWSRMADIPQVTNVGANAIYDTVRNRVVLNQGFRYPRIFTWSPSSTNYVTSGSWYSKRLDLTQVAAWGQLQSTVAGSGVTMYVRTSSGGNVWSDWSQVVGGTITAPTARYAQLKVTITGDGTSTASVSDIVLNYGQETAAPSLPSSFTVTKNDQDTTPLVSGQTYEYQHPVFKWSGSSDGSNGSGIDGYYVYFGLDSGADPATEGSYQKDTQYTVSTAMTAGEVYYVRLKVKDKLGNISPAATYFSYRYWYISPPGSVVKTSDIDFGDGINTGVAINNGSMSLPQIATGSWNTGTIGSLPAASRGGAMKVIGDYIYILAGANTTTFWRYSLTNRTWTTLASIPQAVSDGSSMTYDGGNFLYAIRGNSSSDGFYRYDIVNNTWTPLPTLPANAMAGADIAYIGNNTIAIFFTGPREFYFYDITSRSYLIKTSYPSSVNVSGSGIWWDGNDTIYTLLGWNSTDQINRQPMVAYSIANDFWRTLSPPPMVPAYTQNNLVGDSRGNLYAFGSNYVDNTPSNSKAMRYNIASDSWQMIADYPSQSMYGTLASDGDRYVYIIPSNWASDSRRMIRYDTWEQRFDPSTPSPAGWQRVPWDVPQNTWQWIQGTATTVTYDGSKYIYAVGTNDGYSSRLLRYEVATGETTYLPPPYAAGQGGSLVYSGSNLYYLEARSTKDFFKFDFVNQQWLRMADLPNVASRPGGSTLTPLSDGKLLAMAGNGRLVYKYTPDAGMGSWVPMADMPTSLLYGSATYDSVAEKVYVIAGNTTKNFYEYSVAGNSWTTLASLPENSTYGSALFLNNGKLYAAIGNNSRNAYIYDIGANSWTVGTPLPEEFRYGSAMVAIDATTALSFAGQNSSDLWEFHPPAANQAYAGQAIHISQPMTLAGVYDYAGIQAEVSLPAQTSVEFFTRTSSDGANWDQWQRSTQVKQFSGRMSSVVSSQANRFIQIKVVLSSFDGKYAPTVGSYALDYYYDVDPPTNPTALFAYSDNTKQTALNNNTWYNYATPDFDWPDPGQASGATDGPLGSNIAGYWIYVGTDNTASPKTSGVFVNETEYKPTLTNSGTYYVRLQTQDVTGNIDPNIFAPFIYKFDNQPPTAPTLITVTPSGFTARNQFSFVWPNAFDSHSGIFKYCYHTGATSGPFAVEVCQDGREINTISAAYTAGTNVFYVRTLDAAGNYSASYTTVSYYYTTDPPGPVTNLRAIPPTSTQNLFAFTWDLPATFAGDPDLLEYCYSINILPSPLNTTCTSDKYIPAIKAATQRGTNIIYMAAKDEAGNVNWNTYASANFIANTVSPGIPLNLVVSDTSDRNSNRWSLTPTWDKPTFEGNGVDSYVVERSLDQHTFEFIGRTSTTAFVDLNITPATTYYYRVRAADALDNRGAPSAVVAQMAKGAYADPPAIVVDPVVVPGFDQADITWATERAATSFVYYGTTPANLTQSKGTLDTVTEHSLQITGLMPSTTYYYRVQSFDAERTYTLEDATSQVYTFKTSASARINDVNASDITYNSAVITWQTSVPTRTKVEYGPSLDYALASDGDTTDYSTNHIVKLSGLSGGALYHYRIVATTAQGSIIYSDDYNFSTLARPSIQNIRFQPLDNEVNAAVRVSWTTNVPTSSTVHYSALGQSLESSTSELVSDHEVVLRDLAGSTTYTISIEGRDQYGNLAVSEPQTWQSSVDTRPPQLSSVSLSVTTMQSIGNTRAQLIVSWKTDEPSTSQVYYDKANSKTLSKSSPLDTEPTTNHVVIISDLDLAEIYKTQIISKDINGNTTNGVVTSVVTPDQETNVLDGVLKILQKIFRLR